MKHKHYLLWMLLLCSLTLLPAIILNLILLHNEGDIKAMSFAASEWQQQTHGVTFTPTIGNNGLFKTLRLNYLLPEIDTVSFSASTGFTIDSEMMPPESRFYNFSQSGNPLAGSIAQAEYIFNHSPQVKHFLIALDWSIGSIYLPDENKETDLSPPSRLGSHKTSTPFVNIAALKESISHQRMEILGEIIIEIIRSKKPATTFHEYFFQLGSNEYLCPDGTTKAKDFGIPDRHKCNGFRNDGSATYFGYSRIDDPRRFIIGSLTKGSKYTASLQISKGRINREAFVHLAILNKKIQDSGRILTLFMPPLLPGMESAFLKDPVYGSYLQNSKKELQNWATKNGTLIFDFGSSEKFGCTPSEFIDEHHADGSCYRKIFNNFWQKNP